MLLPTALRHGCRFIFRHVPLQLSILLSVFLCYLGNHCLHRGNHEMWSIFWPGCVGHIHVTFVTWQLPFIQNSRERNVVLWTVKMGFSLLLFAFYLYLFPPIYWSFIFCVVIGFGFHPGSLNLSEIDLFDTPLLMLECSSACCAHMQHTCFSTNMLNHRDNCL